MGATWSDKKETTDAMSQTRLPATLSQQETQTEQVEKTPTADLGVQSEMSMFDTDEAEVGKQIDKLNNYLTCL